MPAQSIAYDRLMPEVVAAVEAASVVILAVYNTAFAVRSKSDASPVTEADEAAERVIMPRLKALLPDVPVISEEAQGGPDAITSVGDIFWLVDPLDGTKEFVARSGDFTVNIALIENGRPTLGVVAIPAMGSIYTGAGPATARGGVMGGPLRPISARTAPDEGLVVLASRSHDSNADVEAFLKDINVAERRGVGSSLKFCRIAEGVADLYPRFGPTSEWDIAAGQAVLEAAGGTVTKFDGSPMRYGKPNFLNPGFVARGRTAP
jgi:3'(2'), 5'-bisphosphate nucleotidase